MQRFLLKIAHIVLLFPYHFPWRRTPSFIWTTMNSLYLSKLYAKLTCYRHKDSGEYFKMYQRIFTVLLLLTYLPLDRNVVFQLNELFLRWAKEIKEIKTITLYLPECICPASSCRQRTAIEAFIVCSTWLWWTYWYKYHIFLNQRKVSYVTSF